MRSVNTTEKEIINFLTNRTEYPEDDDRVSEQKQKSNYHQNRVPIELRVRTIPRESLLVFCDPDNHKHNCRYAYQFGHCKNWIFQPFSLVTMTCRIRVCSIHFGNLIFERVKTLVRMQLSSLFSASDTCDKRAN